mmetsp:Transcript_27152/g.105725  ORF Transcript_27152/g.105725 Transcript_27152/m.105725 type:complete len:86 (-) Transcript_27152:2058-2315(-)
MSSFSRTLLFTSFRNRGTRGPTGNEVVRTGQGKRLHSCQNGLHKVDSQAVTGAVLATARMLDILSSETTAISSDNVGKMSDSRII